MSESEDASDGCLSDFSGHGGDQKRSCETQLPSPHEDCSTRCPSTSRSHGSIEVCSDSSFRSPGSFGDASPKDLTSRFEVCGLTAHPTAYIQPNVGSIDAANIWPGPHLRSFGSVLQRIAVVLSRQWPALQCFYISFCDSQATLELAAVEELDEGAPAAESHSDGDFSDIGDMCAGDDESIAVPKSKRCHAAQESIAVPKSIDAMLQCDTTPQPKRRRSSPNRGVPVAPLQDSSSLMWWWWSFILSSLIGVALRAVVFASREWKVFSACTGQFSEGWAYRVAAICYESFAMRIHYDSL